MASCCARPSPKARFTIGSTEAAKAAPGVHLVLTGADLAHLGDLRSSAMQKQPDGTRAPTRDIPILCRDRVAPCRRRGRLHRRRQPRAGAGRRRADRGRLRFARMRPPLPRPRSTKDTPLVWPELGTQPRLPLRARRQDEDRGRLRQGRQGAVGIKFLNNRLVCNYMEPRSAIGEWKPDEDRFVLTTGSQGVHGMRDIIAGKVFKSRAGEAARHHAAMSAAASARRSSSIANIRWCWRPPSGSAGRSNGPATAPSISWPMRMAATIMSRPRWRSTRTAASSA